MQSIPAQSTPVLNLWHGEVDKIDIALNVVAGVIFTTRDQEAVLVVFFNDALLVVLGAAGALPLLAVLADV